MLPPDYEQRGQALGADAESGQTYWTPDRLANTARYQWHVYRLADSLATRAELSAVLDAGCGVGVKLAGMLARPGRRLWGVDQASAVEAASQLAPGPTYWATDLETPCPPDNGLDVPATGFDLVICADVLEHLADPDPLMRFIHERLSTGGWCVLSTPDRDRLRGRGCMHSPKPDHVREWSRREFVAYVESRGFDVHASRLMPQDDAPRGRTIGGEVLYRSGLGATSPWACHAVVCRPGKRAGAHA